MAKQVTRNIALTKHFAALLDAKVSSGRYQSASEVVREGLRLLEQRDQETTRAQLRRDIEVGWRQSQAGEMVDGPSVFAEIRKMSKARRSAGRSRK